MAGMRTANIFQLIVTFKRQRSKAFYEPDRLPAPTTISEDCMSADLL
jgi:hypothetical protein